MLTPNHYTVRPGSCPVHEVPEPSFSVYRTPTSPPTIVQHAVDPWPSYWRNKHRKEKQS